MDDRWIDDVTRALATGAARRGILRTLIGGGLSGLVATLTHASAEAKEKNKGGKSKGKGGDQGQGQEKVTLCHRGHTITVAEPAVQAHLNHGDVLGACPAGEAEVGEPIVAQVLSFRVDVACEVAPDDAETRCIFTGLAEDGAAEVRRVVVPASEVCAEIVGSEYERVDADPITQDAGYQSTGDGPVVTLVLAGHVTVGGTASYWCGTEDGAFPAPGPGLVCEETGATGDVPNVTVTAEPDDVSETTGALVVLAFGCDLATPESDIDWYGACIRVVPDLTYALTVLDGEQSPEEQSGATDGAGQLRFGPLAPGLYDLDVVDAAWCHAESDCVDDDGNVVVEAGQRCHVWTFICPEESGTPEATAGGIAEAGLSRPPAPPSPQP